MPSSESPLNNAEIDQQSSGNCQLYTTEQVYHWKERSAAAKNEPALWCLLPLHLQLQKPFICIFKSKNTLV